MSRTPSAAIVRRALNRLPPPPPVLSRRAASLLRWRGPVADDVPPEEVFERLADHPRRLVRGRQSGTSGPSARWALESKVKHMSDDKNYQFLTGIREKVASGTSVYGPADSPAAIEKLAEVDARLAHGRQVEGWPAAPEPWSVQRVAKEKLAAEHPLGDPGARELSPSWLARFRRSSTASTICCPQSSPGSPTRLRPISPRTSVAFRTGTRRMTERPASASRGRRSWRP